MKSILLILSTLLVFTACKNARQTAETQTDPLTGSMHNSLTDAEKKEGWELLFDGKTTKGWHEYGKKSIGSAWKVEDNTLHLDNSKKNKAGKIVNGGYIVTDQRFKNFDLKLEWKVSKKGNSGILFMVNEEAGDDEPWKHAPEVQILDNERHEDGKIKKHRAGDLYDLISSSKEVVKPAGEWNQVQIELINGNLEVFLNGVNVVSTVLWEPRWDKLVKGSKFKDFANFATYREGSICLQDHDDAVWFRNIKIRRMDD